MRATRLFATGDIRTVEVPVPEPGPGEVLVRMAAVAKSRVARMVPAPSP